MRQSRGDALIARASAAGSRRERRPGVHSATCKARAELSFLPPLLRPCTRPRRQEAKLRQRPAPSRSSEAPGGSPPLLGSRCLSSPLRRQPPRTPRNGAPLLPPPPQSSHAPTHPHSGCSPRSTRPADLAGGEVAGRPRARPRGGGASLSCGRPPPARSLHGGFTFSVESRSPGEAPPPPSHAPLRAKPPPPGRWTEMRLAPEAAAPPTLPRHPPPPLCPLPPLPRPPYLIQAVDFLGRVDDFAAAGALRVHGQAAGEGVLAGAAAQNCWGIPRLPAQRKRRRAFRDCRLLRGRSAAKASAAPAGCDSGSAACASEWEGSRGCLEPPPHACALGSPAERTPHWRAG